MSSTPENNEFASDTPEVRHAKERLQSLGELLIDTSKLIELLHTKHQADYIDYTLTFPILPYATAVLPTVFAAENPDYIIVTAGVNKASEKQPTVSSALIEIVAPARRLQIVRDSEMINQEHDEDDVLINIQGWNTPTTPDPDTVQPVSQEELQSHLTDTPRIPRHEVNALLMSLALPDQGEYESFKDKNLFEVNTFIYLIEALRSHSLGANTSGFYTFKDGHAELNFTKDNENVSFDIYYMDPLSSRIMFANIDTRTGFVLNFSAFDSGGKVDFSPSNEDIELLRSVINDEIATITSSSEVSFDKTVSDDPETLAVSHIEEQEQTWQDLQNMYEAPDSDQGGFDTPNTGA